LGIWGGSYDAAPGSIQALYIGIGHYIGIVSRMIDTHGSQPCDVLTLPLGEAGILDQCIELGTNSGIRLLILKDIARL
jgi:hypothetical protein